MAIRGIGTNGIPFLLRQLRARDLGVMQKVRPYVRLQWRTNYPFRDESSEKRRRGAYGLAALGTNAVSAVPDLIEIGTDHPEEDGRYMAVFALRTLGPAAEPAIPFLIRCLTNDAFTIRDDAAIALGVIGRQSELSVPALIQFVENRANGSANSIEVRDAIEAIAQFGPKAQVAGPVLLSLLSHSDSGVREAVTNCITRVRVKLP
jgi:HEAT repeat protein